MSMQANSLCSLVWMLWFLFAGSTSRTTISNKAVSGTAFLQPVKAFTARNNQYHHHRYRTTWSNYNALTSSASKNHPSYDYCNYHPISNYGFGVDSSSSSMSRTLLFATRAATSNANEKNMKKEKKQQKQKKSKQQQQKKPESNTGGLRRLPVVKSPIELMDRAKKASRRVKTDSEMKNVRNRARKHGAETLNELSQALCLPLRDIVNGYKREWRRLHPFERVVADLTARARQRKDGLTLSDVLDDIHEARKVLLEAGKDWVARAKHAQTAKEAGDAITEGTDNLLELFKTFAAKPVNNILGLQKSLRSAPIVSLGTPACVLVGAPNVGKSSIVRTISSGTPEINNYPFTTRGMTMGHVEVFWSSTSENDGDDEGATKIVKAVVPDNSEGGKRSKVNEDLLLMQQENRYAFSQLCQVMDTPGLSVRPEDERNEMEALTMAAMQHLPTAVIFVMDLSGQAGDKFSSVEDQLILRKEVRERFPRRPWIDVISKVDLGIVDEEATIKKLEEIMGSDTKYIRLSSKDGTGVEDLRMEVLRMLGEVRIVLDAIAAAEAQKIQEQQLEP